LNNYETIFDEEYSRNPFSYKKEFKIKLNAAEYKLLKLILNNKEYIPRMEKSVDILFKSLFKKFQSQCTRNDIDLLVNIKDGQIKQEAVHTTSKLFMSMRECESLLSELNSLIYAHCITDLVITEEEETFLSQIKSKKMNDIGGKYGNIIVKTDSNYKILLNRYYIDETEYQEREPDLFDVPEDYEKLNKVLEFFVDRSNGEK